LNKNVEVQMLQAGQDVALHTAQGLAHVIMVYLAVAEVQSGGLSLGMMFAFMGYRLQFSQRLEALVEHGRAFFLTGMHLERLADIALAKPERGLAAQAGIVAGPALTGRLSLRNACFRYSSSDPWIIRDLNLDIQPGERVVFTGASGCGKSTLVKLLIGLLEPTSGQLLVDGQELCAFGLSRYRAQVGAVLQGDRLLSGSFADNICCFEPDADFERIVSAAKLAQIHDEIMGLPMQYNGLVGDLGTTLSAGQQQRLLLARALFRRARILFLDEGTANLDERVEQTINNALLSLGITTVIVAHRPDVFSKADRVWRLGADGLVSLERAPRATSTPDARAVHVTGARGA